MKKIEHIGIAVKDLETSKKVRKMISEGKMNLLSEDEYWAKLKSS